MQEQNFPLISQDVWFERELILIITILISSPALSFISICRMSLSSVFFLFFWLTLCWVFCQSGCYFWCLTLPSPSLCAWRAVFSPTLLSTGLFQGITIVSTSHSSRFLSCFPVSFPHLPNSTFRKIIMFWFIILQSNIESYIVTYKAIIGNKEKATETKSVSVTIVTHSLLLACTWRERRGASAAAASVFCVSARVSMRWQCFFSLLSVIHLFFHRVTKWTCGVRTCKECQLCKLVGSWLSVLHVWGTNPLAVALESCPCTHVTNVPAYSFWKNNARPTNLVTLSLTHSLTDRYHAESKQKSKSYQQSCWP